MTSRRWVANCVTLTVFCFHGTVAGNRGWAGRGFCDHARPRDLRPSRGQ
ncbi:MAG: hypothetical protein Ct9H300mP1_38910 [Planctomycetaceae bacterium]|nr:MAG: hypothetical protein Ct9H300mP1_38910 [Planctomycetaceae bacterium]